MQEINEKIKQLRKMKNLSQEAIAEKLGMNTNSYAKLERGETDLEVSQLEKIAQLFNMNAADFFQNEKHIVCLINENCQNSANYYATSEEIKNELEKCRLEIKYKDDLMAQKDKEIIMLNEMLQLYKN